jgi:hypothetical protein
VEALHRAEGQLFAVLYEIECPLGSGGSTRFGHERAIDGSQLQSKENSVQYQSAICTKILKS